MFVWSFFLLGSLACLSAANPIASGPRVILRGGSGNARSMRLMNAQPSGAGELRPECILNPALMSTFAMRGDSPYFNRPNNQQHLVDEEVEKKSFPETPEVNSVQPEDENSLPEFPEGQSAQPEEETTTPEDTSEQTSPADEGRTTVETPTETTVHPDEVASTPETTEESSTQPDEEKTTTETAEEHSEQPDEAKSETPEEEPKMVEEPAAREEPAAEDCEKVTPAPKRKPKSRRPSQEDREDDEEAPRKSSRGGSVYKDFFPVTFGGSGPSRPRDSEEGAGARGHGSVTAIANSFSQGRGAIASSSAVANGSPDAGQYRHSRRSRYRL